MTTPRPSASDIAAALAERAEPLCRELLPAGGREGAEWRVGSVRGEPGQSLGVHLVGNKRGVWRDFADDEAGDALDLVATVLQLDTREAIVWATRWLDPGDAPASRSSGSSPSAPARATSATATPTDDERRRIEYARELWARATPAEGTLVETYLRARGITIPTSPTLRYLAGAKHGPPGLILPAMIAAVQGRDRRVTAVHRTFLTVDGTRKASVGRPRLMLGRCRGGAARRGPAAPRLAVTEGVETGLSVAQACPELSVWAALSTSGMRSLMLPSEVREVLLAADGEDEGTAAAEAAAMRLMNEGRSVRIISAPEGEDFNDVIRRSAA